MKNAIIAALVAVSALAAVVSSADAQPRHWHHAHPHHWHHRHWR